MTGRPAVTALAPVSSRHQKADKSGLAGNRHAMPMIAMERPPKEASRPSELALGTVGPGEPRDLRESLNSDLQVHQSSQQVIFRMMCLWLGLHPTQIQPTLLESASRCARAQACLAMVAPNVTRHPAQRRRPGPRRLRKESGVPGEQASRALLPRRTPSRARRRRAVSLRHNATLDVGAGEGRRQDPGRICGELTYDRSVR